jgi:hypothetical protein
MTVTLEIGVSGRLGRFAASAPGDELVSKVENDVRELAGDLGLTTAVHAEVVASDARRPLRVLVNGASAPYPSDLLWQLWMEHPQGPPEGPNGASRSIADDCLAAHCDAEECGPIDIARLVVSMVRDRPALLVGDDEARSFAAEAGGNGVSPAALRRVMSSLLDLGVAPRPPKTVVGALAANENRVEDSVEAVFAQLQGRRVEIGVSAPYREILTGPGSSESALVAQSAADPIARELFDLLEQRLLVEWGLVPPDIVWSTVHDVPDGRILVKVNDRRSAPCRGLDEGDRILLGDVSDFRLAERQVKRTVLNPVNAELEFPVVDSAVAHQIGSPAAAPPAGFAALVVYREIVANAHRLISTEQVLYLLQDLERRAPELVHLVLRHFTVAEVTQVVRALVRERIPPRLLPIILEQLARLVIEEAPRAGPAEFVRAGLSPYLPHRFAREMGRTFFELPAEVEAQITAAAADDLSAERVRDAVWSSLRSAGVPPVRAGLLVRKARRDLVYELLAPELEELVVLRDSELGSDVPEPMARVDISSTN